MLGLLANLSPKVTAGLIAALIVSAAACGGMGYMLLKSHEKRGELAEKLTTMEGERDRAIARANENAEALKKERKAWDASVEVYTENLRTAHSKAARTRNELRNAEHATNDPLPDSVFDSLPK